MSRPANTFRTLGSVPVHYDRRHPGDYGTRGAPTTFHATSEFEAKLDRCFQRLWELSPFGRAEVITSAGAWVNKSGFHGLGRALDLDGIFWREKSFITLFDGFQGRDRRFYLAIEAVLRMHFGQVLNYDFNAAHHDHFHIDDVAPGFRPNSKTAVFFVQNALSFALGHNVRRDGVFGPETDRALARALHDLGISGTISILGVWQRFLMGVAQAAFQVAAALSTNEAPSSLTADFVAPVGGSFLSLSATDDGVASASELPPGDLLRNVYQVIEQELGCTSLKPRIEGAVTAFANHPDIQRIIEPDDA